MLFKRCCQNSLLTKHSTALGVERGSKELGHNEILPGSFIADQRAFAPKATLTVVCGILFPTIKCRNQGHGDLQMGLNMLKLTPSSFKAL